MSLVQAWKRLRAPPARGRCGTCVHFAPEGAAVEAAFANLAAMSSGHASVRARDGLCARLDRYLPAGAGCAAHSPAHHPA